jgi:adenylosuccinate synthase
VKPRGDAKIGTTGKGIGPAYEDKVARRAIRVADLLNEKRFAEKLAENLDYHNFVLEHYLKAPKVDYQKTLDDALAYVPRLRPMVTDVSSALYKPTRPAPTCCSKARKARCWTSTTAPIRSSPRRTAWPAMPPPVRAWARHAALHHGHHQGLHHPRGFRPFPRNCQPAGGPPPGASGARFGTVTGRARRCGWFDAALLRRSVQINGVTGMCLTKLDVLDGLES